MYGYGQQCNTSARQGRAVLQIWKEKKCRNRAIQYICSIVWRKLCIRTFYPSGPYFWFNKSRMSTVNSSSSLPPPPHTARLLCAYLDHPSAMIPLPRSGMPANTQDNSFPECASSDRIDQINYEVSFRNSLDAGCRGQLCSGTTNMFVVDEASEQYNM